MKLDIEGLREDLRLLVAFSKEQRGQDWRTIRALAMDLDSTLYRVSLYSKPPDLGVSVSDGVKTGDSVGG